MRARWTLLSAVILLGSPAPAWAADPAVTGLVFTDLNFDGTHQPTEPPLAGLSVTVTDPAGRILGAANTGSDGRYRIAASGPVRIAFGLPPRGLYPAPLGPDNGGELQFLDRPGWAGYAAADPGSYCESSPRQAQACAVGPAVTGADGSAYAQVNDVGRVSGLAWAAERGRLFTTSAGAVHAVDPDTGRVTLVAQLPEPVSGIDVSTDGRQLYAAEVASRRLAVFDLGPGDGESGAAATYPIPDPGCVNGTPRPTGVRYRQERVFATVVCSGLLRPLMGAAAGHVYAFDPATRTFDPTPIANPARPDPGTPPSARLCHAAPLELGGRVWRDLDADGIQEAGEPGLGGLVVHLVGGEQNIATKTDKNGGYLFRDADVPGGLTRRGAYRITLDPGAGLAGARLTPRAVGGDSADSLAEGTAAAPFIAVAAGSSGRAGHNYDFGFAPAVPERSAPTAQAPVVREVETGGTVDPRRAVPPPAAADPPRSLAALWWTGGMLAAAVAIVLFVVLLRRHRQ